MLEVVCSGASVRTNGEITSGLTRGGEYMSNVKVNIGGKESEYVEGVYLVFNEDGQGEFIIPKIELYDIKHGIREMVSGTAQLYCPNTKVINHEKNQWARVEGKDNVIVCSECGARMDISNINGRAKLEEK
jgi:hypothetical protein